MRRTLPIFLLLFIILFIILVFILLLLLLIMRNILPLDLLIKHLHRSSIGVCLGQLVLIDLQGVLEAPVFEALVALSLLQEGLHLGLGVVRLLLDMSNDLVGDNLGRLFVLATVVASVALVFRHLGEDLFLLFGHDVGHLRVGHLVLLLERLNIGLYFADVFVRDDDDACWLGF